MTEFEIKQLKEAIEVIKYFSSWFAVEKKVGRKKVLVRPPAPSTNISIDMAERRIVKFIEKLIENEQNTNV